MIRKNLLAVLMLLLLLPAGLALAQELEAPAEGNARVYVFNFLGSVVRGEASMFVDDQYVGGVGSSGHWGFDVEAGEHLVWSMFGGKKSFVRLNAAAGKTYYVHLEMVSSDRFNPVPTARLHNACPNNKKGKGRYNLIEKRLKMSKFTLAENPQERLDKGQEEKAEMIKEVLARWESDWQKSKKWAVIEPQDGN